MSGAGQESEVKIRVDDLDQVRKRIEATGAILDVPSTLEQNLVFDDADGRLVANEQLLRLRRWGDTSLLTFKGPKRMQGAIKIRPEHETVVLDGAATRHLVEALGYRIVKRYEKYREMWSIGPVLVVLDRTPAGDFVELEGPVDDLEPLAAELELDLGDAVSESYLELWEQARAADPSLGEDMVFDQDS